MCALWPQETTWCPAAQVVAVLSSLKLEGSAEVVVHVFKHNKIFSSISGTCKTVFQVFLEIRDDQCRYGGINDENKSPFYVPLVQHQ